MMDEGELTIEINITNFSTCCRLCLSSNESSSYWEVTESCLASDQHVTLAEAIKQIANIEITNNKKLSTCICTLCSTRLDEAYCFIRDICNNNEMLKTYFEDEQRDDQSVSEEENFAMLNHEEVVEVASNSDEKPEHIIQRELKVKDVCNSGGLLNNGNSLEIATETINAVDIIMNKKIPAKSSRKRKSECKVLHQCTTCDKQFKRKSNLIDHERLHEQKKLYKCDYCEKSFVQSGNLRTHIRIHTLETPFHCTICGKSFNQSSTLKIHLRGHAKIKAFSCETCDKSFVTSSDLTKHKLTHSFKKNFECVICEKKYFTQKIHLRNHLNNHHPSHNVELLLKKGSSQ